MKKRKAVISIAICAVLILSVVSGTLISLAAYDGSVNQSKNHADEKGMYLYTFDIELYNPCNSEDMDDDAVYLLWFDFTYKEDNGLGAEKTYRFDMSYKDELDRNLNNDVLKKTFIRPNDNSCFTQMSVWVPGIISNVHIKLNMDGGERLGFYVNGIYLNGFKVNTDVDYVSSAYYDSEADIPCFVPISAAICPDGVIAENAGIRDQYNGLYTDKSIKSVQSAVGNGDYSGIYHFDF